MSLKETNDLNDLDLSFKVFYELMANRVGEILLVSSPYDAFIMEEDGRLAERIIHEYRGLNLTRPPRLTWKSSAREALSKLSGKKFDLVLTMPRIDDMGTVAFCREVKINHEDLPVFLLTHDTNNIYASRYDWDRSVIDREFVWLGNTDLLLALIKSVEDRMNVAFDTKRARVRVIILVEDSPFYRSSILPLLYKEIVMQTQAVCFSSNALGNGTVTDIADIVYVDPDLFNPAHTVQLAGEIGKVNGRLINRQHKYLLMGPGRWGSADRWLGIPVNWRDISGVGVIVETTAKNFRVDPSQGTHFFHNIISMGISYLTISQHRKDFIDFNWLKSLPAETIFNSIRHVRLKRPLTIKIDGKTSRAVILK